ncbi:MAG: protein kinase domain-containing protein [Deltaproteobacteria bacterium]
MEKRWIWPFELEEQIGSGAMGVVFRARYVKNDRRVALKLLPKEVAANPTLAARFQREMEILKDLRHPHIVHAFGGTCEGDQWFYAMELVDGGTLGTLLQEQGRLPWRQAVEFGLQVCAALEYAHSRGVIHRDLKPGNLLLTRAGKVKLGDFGLALVSAETRLTAAGKTMGSLHYMAPEQIQGKPPLSNKTDLYALGCVLFELLCGRTPFTGEAMAEVLQQHIRQAPPRVSSFALDCPIQLEALIAELLQKAPDQRPPSAQAVATRLREIDQDVTVKAPRFDKNRPVGGPGAVTASAPVISATPRTWNGPLVAGLALALAVIGWLFLSRWNQAQLNSRMVEQFVAALRDGKQPPAVQVFAAKSLRELGPDAQGALKPLLEALHATDVPVRVEVAKAIGQIGSGDPFLMAELHKAKERDDQPTVRDALDKAIAQLKKKPNGGSIIFYVIGGVLAAVAGTGYWIWKQATSD